MLTIHYSGLPHPTHKDDANGRTYKTAMCFPTDSIFPFNIKLFTDKKEYDDISKLISKMSVLYIAVKEGENYIYKTFSNVPPPIEIL